MQEQPYPPVMEQPERRAHPRYDVDAAATVYSVGASPVHGRVIEISRTGCRMKTDQVFHVHPETRVEICFTVRGIAFRLAGEAEWSDDRRLFGLRFTAMSSRREGELAELLTELESERAARAARAAAKSKAEPEPSPASTPSESSAEADKLVSAKLFAVEKGTTTEQFLETAAQAAPAPVSEAPAGEPAADHTIPFPTADTPRPARRERRQQKRHSVHSRASIYLVNLRSQLDGLILDVSLSGCRIRTDEPFPVGIYRRVEIGFMLDGLPFRLPGVTQSVHSRFTVGIRFLDLSDRKREQLQFVIDEIEEMRQDGVLPPDAKHDSGAPLQG